MLRNNTLSMLSVCCLATSAAFAGDLTPPTGPIAPTMKSLDVVEPRIAMSQENTPGDASHEFTITATGSYYLTGNIFAVESGILVAASGVTIDLNGFSIIGVPGTTGITTETANISNITIKNGLIANLNRGIDADTANSTFRDLSFLNCGTSMRFFGNSEHNLIENVQCRNGGSGVSASSRGFTVRNVHVTNSDSVGIDCGESAIIESCSVIDSNLYGILVGANSIVRGCVANGSGRAGIMVGANSLVQGCNMTGGSEDGLMALEYTTVKDCNAVNNSGNGYVLQDRCSVFDSTASANGSHGFQTDGGLGSTFVGCASYDNVRDGFRSDEDGTICRQCVAQDNGDDGYQFGINGIAIDCEAVSNVFGFYFPNRNGRAERCRAIENTLVGFLVNNTATGYFLAGNLAQSNGVNYDITTSAVGVRGVIVVPSSIITTSNPTDNLSINDGARGEVPAGKK